MPVTDTLAHPTSDVPTYARVLPIVSLCSSILFAVISVVTWIAHLTWFARLTTDGMVMLLAFLFGLPLSVGGSLFLAFLPALVLRFFVNDRQVRWSLWISGVSATVGGGVWIFMVSQI
ncbi:MAG: hypothetical protein ACKVHE_03400 [Planctomycetales bacterium]|jgi:hypothetical protein